MKFLLIICLALFLGACGNPRVVNTSGCAWTRPIDAIATNDDIFGIFVANAKTLRPLTDQINSHNRERHKNCS